MGIRRPIGQTQLVPIAGSLVGLDDILEGAETAADRAEAAADLATDISGISTSDGVVTTLINNPGSTTAGALSTSIETVGDARYPLKSEAVTPAEFRRRRLSTATVKYKQNLYTTGHGWSVSGTALNAGASDVDDTDDYFQGNQSLKMVSGTGGGTFETLKENFGPWDLTDCSALRLRLKYGSVNGGQNIGVYLGPAGGGSAFVKAILGGGGGISGSNYPWQEDLWQVIDIPIHDFAVAYGSPSMAAINRIMIQATAASGVAMTINVSSVEALYKDPFNAGPAICLTFDDSFRSQQEIVGPDLNALDWPATLFPIIDLVGADPDEYIDLAWIQEMYDDYGWGVGGHAYSAASHGLGLPVLNEPARVQELESIQAWQDAYDFAPRVFAYPLGTHDLASENTVREYYTAAFTATRLMNETVTPGRRFSIQRLNCGYESISAIEAAIDAVVADKGLLVLEFHEVVIGATDGTNNVSPSKWAAILAKIDAVNITPRELGTVIAEMR